MSRSLKIAGFDMGRSYVAWAVLRGNPESGFKLHRHGFIYPPDLGSTAQFGQSLPHWQHTFQMFLDTDLRPDLAAAERFTYRPGGQGGGAEDVNLRLAGMAGPNLHFVRNVDWKAWLKRSVDPAGSHSFFRTPTEHEADACGIALYTGCVILPRLRDTYQ